MPQGTFGQNLVRLFSLPNCSALILKPGSDTQIALTRLTLPNGFAGPTPQFPPEKAIVTAVHLKKPGIVKNWGSWTDGRFRAVSYWDQGGIDIFDLEANPIALRPSSFDSVHIHIPRATLNRYADLNGQQRVDALLSTPGLRDDIVLHWTRAMLPYFNRAINLPQLAIDEYMLMLLSHLTRTYRDARARPEVTIGGLAVWQQERAIAIMREGLDGETSLTEIALECGLSPSHFARSFRRTFGTPVHRYLIHLRVERAKTLLKHSHRSMLDVALDAGFSDQSAFNRSFRALIGASPGTWRRQHRSSQHFSCGIDAQIVQ